MRVEIRLKDYLGPNAKRNYNLLAGDLEYALSMEIKNGTDRIVRLISVPGFTMFSGHPGDAFGEYHWMEISAGEFIHYKSAEDALKQKNGKVFKD